MPYQLPEDIDSDVRNLITYWNIRHDELTNGDDHALHAPPALTFFTATLAAGECMGAIAEAYESSDTAEEFFDGIHTLLVAYGTAMFQFGHTCYQQGVLLANMKQCECLTVTDDDVRRLIDGSWTDDSQN